MKMLTSLFYALCCTPLSCAVATALLSHEQNHTSLPIAFPDDYPGLSFPTTFKPYDFKISSRDNVPAIDGKFKFKTGTLGGNGVCTPAQKSALQKWLLDASELNTKVLKAFDNINTDLELRNNLFTFFNIKMVDTQIGWIVNQADGSDSRYSKVVSKYTEQRGTP